MSLRDRFSPEFRAAFLECHQWGSRRAKVHWWNRELLCDKLAGPLSSTDCSYAYLRDDQYFHGVTDPDSLQIRLMEWHDELVASVSKFNPQTSRQRADFAYMNSRLAIMKELIDALIAVERERFDRER